MILAPSTPAPAVITYNPAALTGWPIIALVIALVAVAAAYILGLRWQNQSLRFRLALLALRLGAVACLLIALLEPAWLTHSTRSLRPTIAVVIDDSTSMLVDQHYQQALDAFAALRSSLVATHDIALYDLTGRSLTTPPKQPAETASPLIDALLSAQQSPAHRQGHFSAPADRAPPQRIVLISDGHLATALPSQGVLDQLLIPVDTIQLDGGVTRFSGSGSSANLAIQSVAAGPNALINNTINVVVDLVADTTPDQPLSVPVTILDGSQIIATRTIAWPAGRNALRAELPMTPNRAGQWSFMVQVGSLSNEVNLTDNRAVFKLNVRAKPLVVVYIDGVVRWEGKFIRQALSDDPDIHVISSVRTTPGSTGTALGLLNAQALKDIDLVILGDVDATNFAASEIQSLERWVSESGGAILLTGGYRSFGPNGFGRSELRTILPVQFTADDQPQIEQPFSIKLTLAGREHPIFHLSGDSVRDAAFYQSLPPLAGCSRVAGVKAGAQVLAVNSGVSMSGGTGGAGGGLPIMVEQQVGEGRTMVFAVDTTWRWRQVVGGFTGDRSFYQRFWGQLVRYMVHSDQAGESVLSLSSDHDRADVGQPITLTASLAQGGRWKLTAMAIDERGRVTSLPLTDVGGGRYTASMTPTTSGRLDWVVRAEAPEGASAPAKPPAASVGTGVSDVLTVAVRPSDLEAGVTGIDRAWLAGVSGRTGGRSLKVDEIAGWASRLPGQPVTATMNSTVRLWDHPLLVGLFFGCLCVEWLLRRRSRLS